jgi:hypothetical protein
MRRLMCITDAHAAATHWISLSFSLSCACVRACVRVCVCARARGRAVRIMQVVKVSFEKWMASRKGAAVVKQAMRARTHTHAHTHTRADPRGLRRHVHR